MGVVEAVNIGVIAQQRNLQGLILPYPNGLIYMVWYCLKQPKCGKHLFSSYSETPPPPPPKKNTKVVNTNGLTTSIETTNKKVNDLGCVW